MVGCSEIHTKHINTLCGQNGESLNIRPGGTYNNLTISLFEPSHLWMRSALPPGLAAVDGR